MIETEKLYKQFVEDIRKDNVITEAVRFHIKTKTPFFDSIFRMGSKSYFQTINVGRRLYKEGKIQNLDDFDKELFESDMGKIGMYEGEEVLLDYPMVDEWMIKEERSLQLQHMKLLKKALKHIPGSPNQKKAIKKLNKVRKKLNLKPLKEAKYNGEEVELNEPKRGGSKKFYVYVKNPDSGKVNKVEFGAEGGGQELSVKIDDPEARKAFASRHNCEQKKDKTTAGYWSCRLPYYAKQLGLSGGGNYYW